MYKEITVLILFSILILSSFIGSSEGIYLNNDLSDLKTMISSSILKSDKHPVFVEYFTQKNNPDNPIISNHLYNLFADLYPYSSEDCEFYFITLLTDVVEEAEKRALDYNIQNYPVVFFDGGFEEINGAQNTIEPYHNAIDSCKTRTTPNVEIEIQAEWFQCPCQKNILTDVTIKNNEEYEYNGQLIISVVLVDSIWSDRSKRPFNYVLIGFVTNEKITIGTGFEGIYQAHYDWTPSDIVVINNCDVYNFLVIASIISDDTGYIDDTSISRMSPGEQPTKPNKPIGTVKPSIKNSYEYKTSSSDLDGDQILYLWDFNGDYKHDTISEKFYSGEEAYIFHTWNLPGNKIIRVKAKDDNGLESFWSNPLPVSVTYNKNIFTSDYFKSFKILKRSPLFQMFYIK